MAQATMKVTDKRDVGEHAFGIMARWQSIPTRPLTPKEILDGSFVHPEHAELYATLKEHYAAQLKNGNNIEIAGEQFYCTTAMSLAHPHLPGLTDTQRGKLVAYTGELVRIERSLKEFRDALYDYLCEIKTRPQFSAYTEWLTCCVTNPDETWDKDKLTRLPEAHHKIAAARDALIPFKKVFLQLLVYDPDDKEQVLSLRRRTYANFTHTSFKA